MPRAPALIPTQRAAATTVEGVLERVIYANDDNAWSVVKLVVAGKSDLVTAVGNLVGVQPGESLRLSDRWATDKQYGEQFRVESYVTVKPATLVGIERYLGSGLVRGVGKHHARARQYLRERAPARPALQRLSLFGRQLKGLDRPANPSLCHRHARTTGRDPMDSNS